MKIDRNILPALQVVGKLFISYIKYSAHALDKHICTEYCSPVILLSWQY